MTKTWRPLAVAVVFTLTLGVGVVSAQTVIVRHAKAGTTIELLLNTTAAGSATADAAGDATLEADLKATLGKDETDAYIYVDACGTLVRVHLVERGVQPPPPGADCTQQQIGGLFWLRQVSSLVVDVAGPNMTMRLKQGPPPAAWLVDSPDGPGVRRSSPTGLVMYGGGGLTMFDNVNLLACGQAPCAKRDMGIAYTGGVTYWLARFAAVDASYMRPAIATADGGETGYRFNSELHSHLLILGGNVGAPIGPTRIYGRVGATYHRASLRTTQTIDDSTVTIDGEEQTIEGGTQSYDLRTAGWGLLYGGGVEAWATPTFAVYFEGGLADVKGSHVDAGEGEIDDRVTYFVFGARFRFGR